jgi:hypothetical protein
MEGAAEAVEVAKIAQDGSKPHFFSAAIIGSVLTLHDDRAFSSRSENVHVDPLTVM